MTLAADESDDHLERVAARIWGTRAFMVVGLGCMSLVLAPLTVGHPGPLAFSAAVVVPLVAAAVGALLATVGLLQARTKMCWLALFVSIGFVGVWALLMGLIATISA